jgi:hypothetical protein
LNQEYIWGAAALNKNSVTETKLTGQLAAPLSISTSQLPRTTKDVGTSTPPPWKAVKITSAKDHLFNDTNELIHTIGNRLINSINTDAGNNYYDSTGVPASINNQRRRKKRRRRI